LSAPDAAQAVASALPAKPVCIGQPARYSGSVIDLSAPEAALAVASALPASCSLASQHRATPVLSLICPLQMGRWLRHPRCRQSLCLGYPPVL
jgi:hypothetical protein